MIVVEVAAVTKPVILEDEENEIEIGEEMTETVVELESTIQTENEMETGEEIGKIVTEIKNTILIEEIEIDLIDVAIVGDRIGHTRMIIEATTIDMVLATCQSPTDDDQTKMMPAMVEHATTTGILMKTNPIRNRGVSSSGESEAQKIEIMRNILWPSFH